MPELTFKFTIIGAGAVGLAAGREISLAYRGETDVLVVEKEPTFGRGISSRNSEVIHSGIYYPTGSLKHRLCIEGRKLLYAYCRERGVKFNKCGKLLVAQDEVEAGLLAGLHARAVKNGVENVFMLGREQALELEPDINVHSALFLTETGIFDTHSYMRCLEGDIKANNGTVLYGSGVSSIEHSGGGYLIGLDDGTFFESEYIINSAGLYATRIAGLLGLSPVTMFPCKGTYFAYSGRHSCRHLVYPIPNKKLTGLGIHATIDLGGRLRFGPDADYVQSVEDFSVDSSKKESFYAGAGKIFKHIDYDSIIPDMAGIRPKIQGPDDNEVKDFYIVQETASGFPRFINLLGIESPGLTASMAIAKYVHGLL